MRRRVEKFHYLQLSIQNLEPSNTNYQSTKKEEPVKTIKNDQGTQILVTKNENENKYS